MNSDAAVAPDDEPLPLAPGEPRPLTGERVLLRPPSLEDAPALLQLFRDPEVSRFFVWLPPRDLADARCYLKGFERDLRAGAAYHFTVLALPSAVPAGVVNLYHLQRHLARAELGIWLGRPYWGRGLGREACCLLLDFAFGAGGFEEVLFRVHPDNRRARRAFARLGALPAGRVSLHSLRAGAPVEHRVYRLTAAHWQAQRVKIGFCK
jgi:RimJ/RimL family protein N-acetyltransferase